MLPKVKLSVCVLVTQLCQILCNPMEYSPLRLLFPWNSPGKNTGVGCQFLPAISSSRGIFLTQGLNPGLLHCKWTLYHLSHQRNPSTEGDPFLITENPEILLPLFTDSFSVIFMVVFTLLLIACCTSCSKDGQVVLLYFDFADLSFCFFVCLYLGFFLMNRTHDFFFP